MNDPGGPAGLRRLPAVDALRGFALLGILVVNSAQIMSPYEAEGVRDPGAAPVDHVATWLVTALASSKFYLLFSFLFGYSFTLQAASAERDGGNVTARFLRRSLALVLLGLVHAVLLYTGDILMTYGLLGLVLLCARRIRPATAVKAAAWIYGVFGVVLTGLGALATAVDEEDPVPRQAIAQAVAAYRGSAGTVVRENLDRLPLALLGVLLMAPGVLAAFFLGLAAGRRRLLAPGGTDRSRLVRVTAVGLAVGVPGAVFFASAAQGPLDERWQLLGIGVGMLTAPALSAAYACVLLLLLDSPWGDRIQRLFAPAGRLALTNYLGQSLIMMVVATAYGLSLYGRVGAAGVLVLAGAVYALQLALSTAWTRRFRHGPAEWLLRVITLAGRPGRAGTPRAPEPAT
ncbi:DUF418 domain-containing protein [Streptomyces lomondensis]|uniref:DUF418 domain-containing protein n=1 Tax=Streptomyces lomondensis TaxID=68229 RepID=A0ABQ2XEN5_9ACTN|nr:DUF418 domain-containing protein [Streptomyces lomondensis]MCF0077679.1 DUF418 domain-containing protein [Streptomyces lomondensis]GGX13286.1 hypothetical protein GCM10010383_49170 [Streptomyces lomondensis]